MIDYRLIGDSTVEFEKKRNKKKIKSTNRVNTE